MIGSWGPPGGGGTWLLSIWHCPTLLDHRAVDSCMICDVESEDRHNSPQTTCRSTCYQHIQLYIFGSIWTWDVVCSNNRSRERLKTTLAGPLVVSPPPPPPPEPPHCKKENTRLAPVSWRKKPRSHKPNLFLKGGLEVGAAPLTLNDKLYHTLQTERVSVSLSAAHIAAFH